jgi:osmotically-inducible protein OsmY
VTINVLVKSDAKDDIEKKDIENALIRNWVINREDIKIDVLGNKVLLSGKIESLYQNDEVGRIAWNAQGVEEVENDLAVEYN